MMKTNVSNIRGARKGARLGFFLGTGTTAMAFLSPLGGVFTAVLATGLLASISPSERATAARANVSMMVRGTRRQMVLSTAVGALLGLATNGFAPAAWVRNEWFFEKTIQLVSKPTAEAVMGDVERK